MARNSVHLMNGTAPNQLTCLSEQMELKFNALSPILTEPQAEVPHVKYHSLKVSYRSKRISSACRHSSIPIQSATFGCDNELTISGSHAHYFRWRSRRAWPVTHFRNRMQYSSKCIHRTSLGKSGSPALTQNCCYKQG